MIIIQDRLYIEIKIDGKPLDGANLVTSIALLEGTPVIAPSMMMVLNDHSRMLTNELCLTDGNEVLITVGTSPQDLKTVSRQYRVYGVKQYAGQAGPQLIVLGIYDAPKYTTEAARESYSGTSAQVIKQIAQKCNLDYDGPENFNGRSTSDSQVWMAVTKTRGAFVQHEVAKHAYMDDHSAMYCALTSLGVLKYRNLMDVVALPISEIKYEFVHNSVTGNDTGREVYVVAQAKEYSQAGLMNAMHNYGSMQITHGPSGESQVEDKVDVKTSAPYLAINDQVAQTVGKTRIEYSPIDCGNVHDRYYRAAYQNIKQLALFTERQSVLVTEPTSVQLMDPVIYKQADADPSRPVRNTDIYVVIGKTVFVRGTHYGERLELARMSITDKGEAQLKSAEPNVARDSSVPEVTIDPSSTVAANSVPKVRSIMAVVGPIETKIKAARESVARVLNNAKLTQPSLVNMRNNIRMWSEKPSQAVQDIRSAQYSVRQMKETARRTRDDLKAASDAIREGNVLLAAANLSNAARSAAQFRPDGIAENLCAMFGGLHTMRTLSESYRTVADHLTSIRNKLDAVENIGNEVDSITSDMYDVIDSYESMAGDVARGYNSLIQAVTGEDPNLRAPNIETNRHYFNDMVRRAATPVNKSLQDTAYLVPTVKDVQTEVARTLTTRDDTRNYPWVPETGYKASPVSLDKLGDKIEELNVTIQSAERQLTEFTDGRLS